MGKVSQILTSSLVCALVLGGSVSATSAGIDNTGPGSTNEITDNSDCTVNVENNNNVDVTSSNDQSSSTGDATNDSNTTGGGATTGSAGNTNVLGVDIGIVNTAPSTPPCVPATQEEEVTPPEGGAGGGQVEGVSTTREVGGMGGGVLAAQTTAPVGGVGAGAGGSVLGLFYASLVTIAAGAARLLRYAALRRL